MFRRNLIRTVHPRVCGELDTTGDYTISLSGSSPRVRGTLPASPTRCRWPRFIPACAGNSLAAAGDAHGHDGSSPRVRGTRNGAGSGRAGCWFIPACAGNSRLAVGGFGRSLTVHPRVCGELFGWNTFDEFTDGSSPRVRGTPAPGRLPAAPRRFIPACAGNSATTRRC